jgi:TRAP-type C4-dicarboxylate transport system permease small subunit
VTGVRAGAAGGGSLVGRIIEWCALAGGVVLLGTALMTTWSAASGLFFGSPLPGDFEMVEMTVAVAAFSFLPYCQLTGANVTADLFTANAGRRTVAAFTLFSALIALAFSVLLLWRMAEGLNDYRRYVETTAILRVPIWWAYVPALVSLALLTLASLITLRDAIRGFARG